MRVYLDAAPVIYLVENVQPFAALVEESLAVPGTELVASDLTRLECRVEPMQDADARLLASLTSSFVRRSTRSFPSPDVMDRATEIRARSGFRTPDAIHIAAARVAGCEVFLTNDHRLDRSVGIKGKLSGPE